MALLKFFTRLPIPAFTQVEEANKAVAKGLEWKMMK